MLNYTPDNNEQPDSDGPSTVPVSLWVQMVGRSQHPRPVDHFTVLGTFPIKRGPTIIELVEAGVIDPLRIRTIKFDPSSLTAGFDANPVATPAQPKEDTCDASEVAAAADKVYSETDKLHGIRDNLESKLAESMQEVTRLRAANVSLQSSANQCMELSAERGARIVVLERELRAHKAEVEGRGNLIGELSRSEQQLRELLSAKTAALEVAGRLSNEANTEIELLVSEVRKLRACIDGAHEALNTERY